MTDDQAQADVAHMPNVKRLLAKQGTTFADAVDSFPLCCPSRATFITGQYAHNHGVAGNFWPFGWYGMRNRGNTLPAWLQKAGYRTALIGKWLNGYGARDAHGEVPKGFDIWRGLLDVSAYDYYNFVMNRNGKLKSWGDADFARKLVEFANIEVTPDPGGLEGVLSTLHDMFGEPPYSYWGSAEPEGLLARRHRPDHAAAGALPAPLARSRSSSGGRPPRRTARTSRSPCSGAPAPTRAPPRATPSRARATSCPSLPASTRPTSPTSRPTCATRRS